MYCGIIKKMPSYVRYEVLGTTRTALSEPSYDPTYVPTKEAIEAVNANLQGKTKFAALPAHVQKNYLKILGHLECQGVVVQTWDQGFVIRDAQQRFNTKHTRSGRAY